jgi:hypothetical protein
MEEQRATVATNGRGVVGQREMVTCSTGTREEMRDEALRVPHK